MKLKTYLLPALLTVTFLFTACKKPNATITPAPQVPYPVISTTPVTGVAEISAICGGNVTFEGTSALTAVGVCWDVNPSPTTLKSRTIAGAGTGNFQSQITGLNPDTKYYVRAYATNAAGTSYGEEMSFKTLPKWVNVLQGTINTFIYAITAHGSDLYIGGSGANGNIMKSSDNGNTFTQVGANLNIVSVTSMLSNGSTLFVGSTSGLFKTTDGGASFVSSNSGVGSGTGVTALNVKGSTIFRGTAGNGLYTSNDDGATWTTVSAPGISNTYIGSIVVQGNNIYVTAGNMMNSIFLSTDNGVTWTDIGQSLPLTGSTISEIFASNNAFYACLTGNQNNGVYKSTNNGSSWTQSNNGLPLLFVNNSLQSGNFLLIGTNGNGVYISGDEGNNWSALNAGLPLGSSVQALGKNNTSIFVSVNGALYRRNIQ